MMMCPECLGELLKGSSVMTFKNDNIVRWVLLRGEKCSRCYYEKYWKDTEVLTGG